LAGKDACCQKHNKQRHLPQIYSRNQLHRNPSSGNQELPNPLTID
jgi:hypothetical protein